MCFDTRSLSTTRTPHYNASHPQHVFHNIRYYICCGQHEHMLWACDVENTVILWRTFVKCCGFHVVDDTYMLWIYVVDIIIYTVDYMLWMTCCARHLCVVDLCCGHCFIYCGLHVVDDMLWTTSIMLWGTCCPQCVPHNIILVVHNMLSTT